MPQSREEPNTTPERVPRFVLTYDVNGSATKMMMSFELNFPSVVTLRTFVTVAYVVPVKSPLSLCTALIPSSIVDQTSAGFTTYRSDRSDSKKSRDTK